MSSALCARTTQPTAASPIKVMPLVEERVTKIRKEDIEKLPGLYGARKAFLLILFDAPMTLREAFEYFDKDWKVSGYAKAINVWARAQFGKNAIIKEFLTGKSSSEGFWVLKLNSEIFDVDYSSYDVKKQLRLVDILNAGARLIIHKLVELGGWATIQELRQAGISKVTIERYLILRNRTTNRQAVDKGFPPPVLKTRTEPDIYILNKKFAKVIRLEVERRMALERMFLPLDLKIILYLAATGGATPSVLISHCNVSNQTIWQARKRINERCKEFDLPAAITQVKNRGQMLIKLANRFLDVVRIDKGKDSVLSTYFTSKQIKIIRFLEEHPFSKTKEIADALGVTVRAVNSTLDRINAICIKQKLPQLLRLGDHDFIHALGSEFITMFGLRRVVVNSIDILRGEEQRKVYGYFEANRHATTAEAADALGKTYRATYLLIQTANHWLVQAGFLPILPRKRIA